MRKTISRSAVWHALLGLFCWLLLTSDPQRLDSLAQARQTGVLRVASINGPLTVYETAYGLAGFEHELVMSLARDMGLRVRWHFYPSLAEAFAALRAANADLVAAAWSPPTESPPDLLLTQPYRAAQQVVAYTRQSARSLKTVDQLQGELVHVPAEFPFADALAMLPEAQLVRSRLSAELLLEELAAGEIDFVLVDADALTIARRASPELKMGPGLGRPVQKVWAIRRNGGEALWRVVNDYLRYADAEGTLDQMRDLHFRSLDRLDDYAKRAFRQRVETRLPKFRPQFEKVAKRLGLDWRFLAAMAYQESSWDATAVSRTGVRGLMMLTNATAKEMGVRNRLDPAQSIDGGARYFLHLHQRVDPIADEPDRTWIALAAYNMGMGHVRDLQGLTHRLGGDIHRWVDLRENLQKLMQPRWYSELRHGYARGSEARGYVANIRAYYELLKWLFPNPDETTAQQPVSLPPEPLEKVTPRLPNIMLPSL